MQKIFTVLLLFATTFTFAQIPNGDFENWNNGNPANWTTGNSPGYASVSQSNNAYTGSSAVQLNVIVIATDTFPANMILSYSAASPAYLLDTLPGALNGWYIGNFTGADELSVESTTKSATNSLTGLGALIINQSTAVYKQFSVPFETTAAFAGPDSVNITFSIGNSHAVPSLSTYAIIDDLSFGSKVSLNTAIDRPAATAFLESCSPNPVTGTANIIYSLTGASTVSLVLYDITGNQVKTLLEGVQQTDGRYKVPVDVSNLSNGVYLYSLMINGHPYNQKMVVAR